MAYGVERPEYRRIRPDASPRVSSGMGVNDLYAAALGQESFARALNQAVIQEMARRTPQSVSHSRAGVDPRFTNYLNQYAGASIRPVEVDSNPAIETAASGQMARASQAAMIEEMNRIIAERSPGFMEKVMGTGLPAIGAAIGGLGGLGMEGGWSGAQQGGYFGGLLGSMLRGY